jgi:hypothetical protein
MAKAPRPSPRSPWTVPAVVSTQERRGMPSENRWSAVIPLGQQSWPSGPRLRSVRNPASADASAAHVPEPGTLKP